MSQRFNAGDKVQLKVEKNFVNPSQTLPAGSKGTVLLKLSDGIRYRIQFENRVKMSIISDKDLK